MKRFVIVFAALFAFAASLGAQMADPIGEAPDVSVPGTSVYEAIELFDGTWRLLQRLNPDGTEQRGLEGTMVITLKPHRGRLLGVRALGVFYAEESGVVDDSSPGPCSAEDGDRQFYSESNATWWLGLQSESDMEALLTLDSIGTYQSTCSVHEAGPISHQRVNYRLHRTKAARPGLNVGPSVELMPGPHSGAGSAERAACCSIGTLFSQAQEMRIGWDSGGDHVWMKILWRHGGQDIWRRDPAGCEGYFICDGTLGQGINPSARRETGRELPSR